MLALPGDRVGYLHGGAVHTVQTLPRTSPAIALDGAVLAVRSHPDIDADRVGFYGASEAGWVVPLADSRLSKPVAFTALVDGPAVTTGEEKVWSDAAGEDEDGPLTAEKKVEATQKLTRLR